MSDAIVQTKGVTKTYRRGKTSVQALRGVDLEIAKGETLAVVGPSGSGKSTLLNLIGGLDRPSNGKVIVEGEDLGRLGDNQLADYRLRKLGFIFQFYNLVESLPAVENVELPMGLANVPVAERRNRAMGLLRAVGLKDRADHMPDEMSGGEQQRVAVARALANNPTILLGDEPTGDLDSKSASALMDLMKTVRKERHMTMVFVTHDPIVVARCDRGLAIRDGRVVQELSPKEIESAQLSDKYDRAMMEGIY
jgi:putative ABC transport system ATP-binding protein